MRIHVAAFLGALLAAAAFGANASADTRLTLLNWSDYLPDSLLSRFEAETGIAVVYDAYENGEDAETRLIAGGSGYDVAVVSSEYIERMVEGGALAEIDRDLVPGVGNLDAEAVRWAYAFDRSGDRAIPYLWGTTGIGYDAQAVARLMPDAPVDSWAMIFEPEIISRFADCGVSIVDSPEEILAAALIYLGHDGNSRDADEIAAAQTLLSSIRPYVRFIDSSQIEVLVNGEACLVVGWSGDVLAAADGAADGIDVQFRTPREGAPVWIDMFVIPVDAPNLRAAHLFIDFMMRPEVIAACANELWYAHPNTAATPLTDEEILNNPAIYPPAATRERLVALRSRAPAEKRGIVRRWTLFKLG